MVNFPASLDSLSNPTATTKRNDAGFELHAVISTLNDLAELLEAKVGISESSAQDTPVINSVPWSSTNGKSKWTNAPTIGGLVTVGGLTSAGVLTMSTSNTAVVPAAVSGTPAQHGLYRDNVVKGWIKATVSAGTPSIAGSFNVSGITDTGVGLLTVTWDRDFASTSYAVVASIYAAAQMFSSVGGGANAPTAGACLLVSYSDFAGTTADPVGWMAIAIGPQ